jgi:diguanylate cyclase (GGDEF)-like protein
MPELTPDLSTFEPAPFLLDKLILVQRVFLTAVALIAVGTLCGWLIPAAERFLPDGWNGMRAQTALAALLSALGLIFSEHRRSRRMYCISLLFSCAVGLLAAAVLAEYAFHISLGVDILGTLDPAFPTVAPGRMAVQSALAFELLAIAMILVRLHRRFAAHVADVAVSCLCLTVLILVAGHIFGTLSVDELSFGYRPAPQTLLCLAMLTLVVFTRNAKHSFFRILLGRGIGSRIARFAAPIVIVLPFLRETVRIHVIRLHLVHEEYLSATGASFSAIVTLVLVLVLAWRINGLEEEVRELSLRDELTGLYNRRGFYMFAEQPLRVARRSRLPFCVFFMDMDNLKRINDSFGHDAGSMILAETGKILNETFRETDVLGRIGGDEFAVAGQFSEVAISIAANRLQAIFDERNSDPEWRDGLHFSLGFAVSDETGQESLQDLLARADHAMYLDKRRKKVSVH